MVKMHFTSTFVLQYCKHHHQPTQQDRNSALIQGSDLLNNHSSTILEVQKAEHWIWTSKLLG